MHHPSQNNFIAVNSKKTVYYVNLRINLFDYTNEVFEHLQNFPHRLFRSVTVLHLSSHAATAQLKTSPWNTV